MSVVTSRVRESLLPLFYSALLVSLQQKQILVLLPRNRRANMHKTARCTKNTLKQCLKIIITNTMRIYSLTPPQLHRRKFWSPESVRIQQARMMKQMIRTLLISLMTTFEGYVHKCRAALMPLSMRSSQKIPCGKRLPKAALKK